MPSFLTALQIRAARLFFALPQSTGFSVAGGAALIARGLINRATEDVDLFLLDSTASSVGSAATSFETELDDHGWGVRRVVDHDEFVRLEISDDTGTLLVDLGVDSPAGEPVGTRARTYFESA